MFICISNTSKRSELTVGQSYELFKHEQHPKIVWVKIPCSASSVGYKTIQCYLADFQSVGDWRNNQIDKILS